jgi:hypothetical protein
MKSFCLRLAVFLLMGIPLLVLSPQKALAKDSYGLTWTHIATPSAVIVDTSDNIYYAGYLASNSATQMNPNYVLDPLTQTNDSKTATTGAVFLTKLNSDHVTYGYSYIIEADQPLVVNDRQTSILLTKMATDSADNVYLLGSFNGNVNFNATGAGSLDFISSNGETWQFLTEIDKNGVYKQTYVWPSKYITLNDIALGKDNSIYVAGTVNNSTGGDIDVNLDIFTGTASLHVLTGDTVAFYTKLGATPNTYDNSAVFKNTAPDHLELDHMALDSMDNVFLFGVFSGTVDFSGAGANKTSAGGDDLYLNEFDSSGAYQTTLTIGGTGNESAGVLSIDNDDNIYYTGKFGNIGDTINLDPIGGGNPGVATYANQPFLTKLTTDGTAYGYSDSWKTSGLTIEKIAFYENSLVYLVGEALGDIDYNPQIGDIIHGNGGEDAFLTVLNPDGTYNYSYVWGGLNDERATDGAFDFLHNFYVAGSTQSLSIQFDPVANTNTQVFDGGENGYITQFSNNPYVPSAPPSDNTPQQNNNSDSSNSTPPTCTGSQPSAPSIFQIWASIDQATMHFVPSQGDENSYTVSYGLYSGADMYNVTFNYQDKQTAIPYTIKALSPGTVYYFKVRANNGCMPGPWSNTLSLRTAYSVGSTSTAYANSSSGSTAANGAVGGSCSEYTVLPGDSFWAIAQKVLGAGGRYFQLWNANKTRFPSLNSSSIIRVGWTLSVGC